MLEIRKLHTHYGPSHIIQGIDLTVRDGEVFGIFGRNGVGKTTLLKTIAGWIKPTAGEIEFGGVRIDGLNADRIARRGVGFVPEDRRIFPGLTVEENITLGFLQTPERSAADNRAALQAVYARFPHLSERRAQLVSHAVRRRTADAGHGPRHDRQADFLLIDEPSEGLAPMIVTDLFAIIKDMKQAGSSVLLVEQNVHQALTVCDQFAVIERGTIVLRGRRITPPPEKSCWK